MRPLWHVDPALNWGREAIAQLATRVQYDLAVDLGAGTGDDLATIQRVRPSAETYGVEVFPNYQRRLRSKGFKVLDLDLEKQQLPFGSESVDLIISNQTFEHMKDIFWVLHEATRVLRVGGHFVVGVPNLASLHNRLLLLAGRQPTSIYNRSAHIRGYTKSDFVGLLDAGHPGGYHLLETRGGNFYPFGAAVAKPLAKIWPTASWAIFMLFRKTRPYGEGFLDYPIESWLETEFYLGPDTAHRWAARWPSTAADLDEV